jgi:hypothetical protein
VGSTPTEITKKSSDLKKSGLCDFKIFGHSNKVDQSRYVIPADYQKMKANLTGDISRWGWVFAILLAGSVKMVFVKTGMRAKPKKDTYRMSMPENVRSETLQETMSLPIFLHTPVLNVVKVIPRY